jgi:hypothetical protein
MKKEKLLWWLIFIPFAGIIFLLILGLISLTTLTFLEPSIGAFLIGVFGFWLFANRLIFGYGEMANLASEYLAGKISEQEAIKKGNFPEKTKKPEEEISRLSFLSLITLWQASLEPYRYAFYLGFFVLLILDLVLEGEIINADMLHALFLGALIPVLLVWSMEHLAGYYVEKLAKES